MRWNDARRPRRTHTLPRMRHFTDLPVLPVDDDGLARVHELVGAAAVDSRLWIMFVDGDGWQSPVLMPIDGIPHLPEPQMSSGLGEILGGLRDQLATDRGQGSVILTRERFGPDEVTAADIAWADALRRTCRDAAVTVRGLFLSTSAGVARI